MRPPATFYSSIFSFNLGWRQKGSLDSKRDPKYTVPRMQRKRRTRREVDEEGNNDYGFMCRRESAEMVS